MRRVMSVVRIIEICIFNRIAEINKASSNEHTSELPELLGMEQIAMKQRGRPKEPCQTRRS